MFCCNINSFYVITNQRLFIKEGQFNEKTVSLILAMIVMFSTVSSVTTFATDDGVYKDFKYTVNSDSSVTISGYTGNDSSVKIPDSIGGKSVESIGNSVTKIGKAAFSGCSSLAKISIPEGVTRIENSTFASTGLETIEFPNSLKSIGDEAFGTLYNIKNVTFSAGLESVSPTAFADCSDLKSYDVVDENPNLTTVDGVLFSKDKTVLMAYPFGKTDKSYTVPEGTKSIVDYAILNSSLESVTLPESIESLDKQSVGYMRTYGLNAPVLKESFIIYNQSDDAVKKHCDKNDIALFTAEPSQNIKSVSLESGKTAVFTISNTNDAVYSTSDRTIADVDQNGTVTAKSKGTTDLIASVGTKYFYCKVNVTSGEPKDSDCVYSGFDTKGFNPLLQVFTTQDSVKTMIAKSK